MELIKIIQNFYGFTQKEAKNYIKTIDSNTKNAIIKAFENNAKKAFYED